MTSFFKPSEKAAGVPEIKPHPNPQASAAKAPVGIAGYFKRKAEETFASLDAKRDR